MTPTHIAVVLSGGLALTLVGAAVFGSDGIGRHEQLERELERVRALNAQLQRENRRLEVERRALRHDGAYIDAVIRDDLGFVRPDEIVFELPPEAP